MSEDAGLSRGGLDEPPASAGGAQLGEAGGVVDGPRECLGCGYELRGQLIAGVCPECGRGVRDTISVRLLRHEPSAVGRRLHAGVLLFAIGPAAALGVQILLVLMYLISGNRPSKLETLDLVAQVLSIGSLVGALIGACWMIGPSRVGAVGRRTTIAGVAMMSGSIGLLIVVSSAPNLSGEMVRDVGSWLLVGGICLIVLGGARAMRDWSPCSNSASGVRIARRYERFARAFVVLLLILTIASNVLLRFGEQLFVYGQRGGIDWFMVFSLISGGLTLSLVVWMIVSAVVHVRLGRRINREIVLGRSLGRAPVVDR